VLLRRDPRSGRSEIVSFRVDGGPLRERRLFTGPGRISDVAFAPDGRWLLVGWRDADQWVFLHLHDAHVRAVSGVGAQFSPGTPRRSTFPRVRGWCC
jgi:WD40 repeat protein